MTQPQQIVPREKLDFGLDGDIPKHWFGGDPFKSRFFDAMSTIFPEGERYFISCVRDYRDQVSDPKLLQDIKDFMRQEGQHGLGLQSVERAQLGLPARHMVQQALRHLQRREVAAAVALDHGQGSELVQGGAHGLTPSSGWPGR